MDPLEYINLPGAGPGQPPAPAPSQPRLLCPDQDQADICVRWKGKQDEAGAGQTASAGGGGPRGARHHRSGDDAQEGRTSQTSGGTKDEDSQY